MPSRAALGLLTLVLVAPSPACRGDYEYNVEADNLLGNSGFELWTGDQANVWSPIDATFTRTDEARSGEFAGILSADVYASVAQTLEFPEGQEAGTCLRGGASLRWLSGSNAPPSFLFSAVYEDGTEELHGDALGWTADGEWHDVELAQVELPKTATALYLSIGNNTPDPHSFAVDEAWLRIVDCD